MKKTSIRKYFLVLFLLFSLQGCGWMVDLVFPLDVDRFLGEQFYKAAVTGDAHGEIYKDKPLEKYLQSIVDRILKSKSIQYKDEFKYKVTIIDDDKVINAICAPGGYIFVYTGLLHFVKNEATLAGILSHEIAHAERRHSTKQLSTNITLYFALYFVLSYVLGPDLAQHSADIAGLSTNLLGLVNSRSMEEEADEYGFDYMRSTPYYPGAIADFFKDLQQEKKKNPELSGADIPLEKYLSTHPLDEDRISANERRLKEAGIGAPNQKSFFKERYRNHIEKSLGTKEED
ncbi:M48 family metalloprotease [Leptospira sp. WS58.C1]|uniref:M48 family metalloprotease n=1 Tax=Leptospira TaxID=171 RepID=UPI0002BE1140|nr:MULTISPECIES: M48 family metalloprotease [unclassified Leptospira]EMK01859.1 peptidase, M48 family [Leptospira sp. B5-022]MCR1793481.1 M48 family metalloprotease [Leptospira sp. id769339]